MAPPRKGPAGLRAGAPPSPKEPARWHRLFVIPTAGEHWFTALADEIVWVWRHYIPGQRCFKLCGRMTGVACTLCNNRYGVEQSGYLPSLHGSEQVTAVITSGAWLHSPSLQKMQGTLRGYRVYATRLHPRANGPLRMWLPGDVMASARLPKAWDVMDEIAVRYGLLHRDNAGQPRAHEETA